MNKLDTFIETKCTYILWTLHCADCRTNHKDEKNDVFGDRWV